MLTLKKTFFPAGIVHFLLVGEGRNILSERLVFSLQKSALAQTEVRLDRENYLAREKVDMDIQIKDIRKPHDRQLRTCSC